MGRISRAQACKLVALDKSPGVMPDGIGEVYRRLMAKCVQKAVGHQATDAAGNLNLCAGLPARIKGAIHAVQQATAAPPFLLLPPEPPNLQVPLKPPGADPMEGLHTQPPDPPAEPSVPSPTDPSGALLMEAMNGFNKLGRPAMLWTVRHRWAAGALFAFNCYRHSVQLILRQKGKPGYTLLSAEGVTQGNPLSMIFVLTCAGAPGVHAAPGAPRAHPRLVRR
jgi:hypothetical protein